ncbi:MAG: pro-sigmaK processing inhibitor BofA family protein [Halobacteriaceae archaeon]
MVTGLEVAVVVLALVLLFGAYRLIKAVKPFIVNAVLGLVVFLLAELLFGVSVAVTPIAILVVAIGGVPGAILVLLLAVLDVAFVPGLLSTPWLLGLLGS